MSGTSVTTIMENWTTIVRQKGRRTKVTPQPTEPIAPAPTVQPSISLPQPSSSIPRPQSIPVVLQQAQQEPVRGEHLGPALLVAPIASRTRSKRKKPAAKRPTGPVPKAYAPQHQVIDVVPRKLRLARSDLTRYRDGHYPRVTEVVWRAGSRLDADVLKAFPNLQILDCNNQGIDDIEAISCCRNLRVLKCAHNSLVVIGSLAACTELVEIDCSNNEIVSLFGLGNCTRLKKIYCQRNNLTSLDGLEGSKELTHVSCSNNNIGNLEPLRGCSQLYSLDCHYNELRTLDGIKGCSTLARLACHHNQLVHINALRACSLIETIDCSHNRLGDLTGLENKLKLKTVTAKCNRIGLLGGLAGCINLQELWLERNKIRSTRELGDCPSLVRLHLTKNYLTDLELSAAPKLKEIACEKNALQVMSGLVNCPALKHLRCEDNSIVSVTHLHNCINLKDLHCSDNLLARLKGLEALPNLSSVDCNKNCLETLEGLEGCRSLTSLNCKNNCITNLEHIIRLRNLRTFKFKNNPLGIMSPQVQHFVHMMDERRRGRSSFYYTDAENVMSSAVKDSVFKSIQSLMRDPTPAFTLRSVEQSGMSPETIERIGDNCADTSAHSELLVSYKQLFSYVWQRIQLSEHKTELLKILEQQVNESANRCLIGRLTRVLAALVGFYDDIHIAISPSSQIHAIVHVTKASMKTYDAATHRILVQERLHEINYTDEEIQPWLDAIYDPNEHA